MPCCAYRLSSLEFISVDSTSRSRSLLSPALRLPMAYIYDAIKQGQTRLVRFDRGSGSRSAVIQTFPLGQPAPPYFSLSYSWQCAATVDGIPDTTQYEIDTGSGKLLILETVDAFVRVLHLEHAELGSAWWWIDSISINLKDINERSQQLRLMNRIYRESKDVIVWLGEETACTDRSVDFIELLNATVRRWPRATPEEI